MANAKSNISNKSTNNGANKVTIYIDNVAYQVDAKDNLLAGVLSEKLNLPYFCWHPSMGSVGACRQCAVTQFQDENDTRGRMVMSCMTPVVEGMRIGLNDHSSSKFREQVIAAMMTNHPHDCPVCAEGGECHLQDMTVMTGHTSRNYCGSKRTFENQNLGPLVGHEMNRCITCYRCVRFYNDYAGGDDFGVFGSSNHVYFGRQDDGILESEFSGNLVEVCPTGVFTNKLFSAHYTRKWDLQSAPSICSHCSVGCNTSIGERYGSVRRVVNRYNHDINGYFLCDRGRFGIGFVNGEQRIRVTRGIIDKNSTSENPKTKIDNYSRKKDQVSTLDVAKALVHFRNEKFIGVGSSRASLEANFYLKQLVGDEFFSAGYDTSEMAMAAQHQRLLSKYTAPSLSAIEQCDFVVIIGEDISQISPRVALSVRQALRNASFSDAAALGVPTWQDAAVRTIGGDHLSPLFMLNSVPTKLDKVAEKHLLLTPTEIISRVKQLTDYLQVLSLSIDNKGDIGNVHNSENAVADDFIISLVSALLSSRKPLIISGYSLKSAELLSVIDELMTVLHSDVIASIKGESLVNERSPCALAILPNACNSIGVLSLLDEHTLSIEQIQELLKRNQADSIILLEQELASFNQAQIDLLRSQVKTMIVLDHSEHYLSACADIVMPVSAISEANGHFVNYQGYAQRFYQVHTAELPIQESWRWLDVLANNLFNMSTSVLMPTSSSNRYSKSQHQSLFELHQFLSQLTNTWPNLAVTSEDGSNDSKGIARQTHRASGRTSLMSNVNIHESKTIQSVDDSFNFSMEGRTFTSDTTNSTIKTSTDMPFTWAPGWNSNQSISQFQQTVGGPLALANHTQGVQCLLVFKENDLFSQKWPVNFLKENVVENEVEGLTFIPQTQWFQGDWQCQFVPEFTLLFQGNTIAVASQYAKQQGWQEGQYIVVKFKFRSPTSLQPKQSEIVAKLTIDRQLLQGLAYGQISDLTLGQKDISVILSEPTTEQIVQHQQQQKAAKYKAETTKKNILTRLQKNDQYIPIRLVSGGLDDG